MNQMMLSWFVQVYCETSSCYDPHPEHPPNEIQQWSQSRDDSIESIPAHEALVDACIQLKTMRGCPGSVGHSRLKRLKDAAWSCGNNRIHQSFNPAAGTELKHTYAEPDSDQVEPHSCRMWEMYRQPKQPFPSPIHPIHCHDTPPNHLYRRPKMQGQLSQRRSVPDLSMSEEWDEDFVSYPVIGIPTSTFPGRPAHGVPVEGHMEGTYLADDLASSTGWQEQQTAASNNPRQQPSVASLDTGQQQGHGRRSIGGLAGPTEVREGEERESRGLEGGTAGDVASSTPWSHVNPLTPHQSGVSSSGRGGGGEGDGSTAGRGIEGAAALTVGEDETDYKETVGSRIRSNSEELPSQQVRYV